MCSSPWLIAACHVLHRLLMPRHSPCALISLTSRTIFIVLVLYQELCRPQILVHCSFCYPNLWLKSTKICTLLPLLLLARNFLLCFHCSVFKVQVFQPFSRSDWNAPSIDKTLQSNLKVKLVGPSGLEPPTSRLSVVRSSQLSYGPVSSHSSSCSVRPLN